MLDSVDYSVGRSTGLQVSAAGQRAHSPYCGVHVAPHTADQTVNTDNRQQPLNKPEVEKEKKTMSG